MSETYYKTIDGKDYNKEMLDIADNAIEGAGDGRISLDDAKKLLAAVKDANNYTDVEKDSMKYIRDNYKFTDESDDWFRTEIRKWAGTKKFLHILNNTNSTLSKSEGVINLIIRIKYERY